MNIDLNTHYKILVGLNDEWEVSNVDLSLEKNKVTISVSHAPQTKVTCPKCGDSRTIADHAPERKWRHLDTMQFQVIMDLWMDF